MHSEAVIGNVDSLFETDHALYDPKAYPTIRASKAYKVVLVDNFGWKDVKENLHILETRHGGGLVEILDVKGEEACIGRGQGDVDQYI